MKKESNIIAKFVIYTFAALTIYAVLHTADLISKIDEKIDDLGCKGRAT